MEEERFDVKKATVGLVKPMNYWKAITFGFNWAVLLAIGIGIYTVIGWIFPKKTTQTQNQTSSFVVESGATVENLHVTSSQEQKDEKRTVGLEFEASSEDAGVNFIKYINDKWKVGIGARWKYETNDDELSVVPNIKLGVDF